MLTKKIQDHLTSNKAQYDANCRLIESKGRNVGFCLSKFEYINQKLYTLQNFQVDSEKSKNSLSMEFKTKSSTIKMKMLVLITASTGKSHPFLVSNMQANPS